MGTMDPELEARTRIVRKRVVWCLLATGLVVALLVALLVLGPLEDLGDWIDERFSGGR